VRSNVHSCAPALSDPHEGHRAEWVPRDHDAKQSSAAISTDKTKIARSIRHQREDNSSSKVEFKGGFVVLGCHVGVPWTTVRDKNSTD